MKQLFYTPFRILTLHALLPDDAAAEARQRADQLVAARDEEGLIAFLEQQRLPEASRRRVQLVKQARPIALQVVELWRAIPYPHDEVMRCYAEIRRLKDEFDRASEPALL
ncbi:MAG: hypothetical protein L0214_12435 [candidate division NC10 bacterium]|nr:hypothetical protein [candidate division NC10 bacterium]